MDLNKIYQEIMALYHGGSIELSSGCVQNIFDMLLITLRTAELKLTSCILKKDDARMILSGQTKPDCFGAEGTLAISIDAMDAEDGKAKGEVIFSCSGEYDFSEFFVGNTLLSDSVYRNFRLRSPVFRAPLEEVGRGMDFTASVSADFSGTGWDAYRSFSWETLLPASGHVFSDFMGRPCVNMDLSLGCAKDTGGNPLHMASIGKLPWKVMSARLAFRMAREQFSEEIKLRSLLILGLQSGDNGMGDTFGEGICLQIPILTDAAYVTMSAYFAPVLSIGNVVTFLGRLAGEDTSSLFPKDTFLSAFGLRYMGFLVDKDLSDMAKPREMDLLFLLERPWRTPIPHLSLDRFQVAWTASWPGKGERAVMTAELLAQASLQLGNYKIGGQLRGWLPQMLFEGSLTLYKERKLSLRQLAGNLDAALPEKWSGDNQIAAISVRADLKKRTAYLSAQAENVLSISIGSLQLRLETISAWIGLSPSGTGFGIEGGVAFGEEEDGFMLLLSAQYADGWSFTGTLGRGEVNIGRLLEQMFGVAKGKISEEIFTISLQEFEISYSVKTGRFELYAVMMSRWPFLKGLTPELGGRIKLTKQEKGDTLQASAAVFANIGIFSCLAQVDDFYGEHPEYLFRVQIGKAYVQGVYTEKSKTEHILTLSLGGMTLGDIVEALIHMVNPNAKARLESPWDILHKISLSAFLLEINVLTKTAVFWVNIGKSLAGLIELDRIGLKYENGHISYQMTGKMLGQVYHEADPISWDAQNGKPPSPSAQETKIYYAGIGQRIAVDVRSKTIADAVKEVSKAIKPGQPALAYREENGFLFAADLAVKDMFRLKAAFIDPQLYGAQIVVSASEQSPIAVFHGLELELLYRRISGSVGMFSCTLIVPKRFSVIHIGDVTVYIGRIHAEIYTNGSFLIDLGFPHNEDFSQSFGVDFGIYTGRGGIYFGVLKGDAVKNVPVTDKGVFSPVIRIGLGVSLGLGRSFDFGIVKGSVSLVLLAFFEGVFGIFHPVRKEGEEPQKEELYYHIYAKAGICGTLFLSVDFKIIAISASARIEAACSVELESYKDAEVTLRLALEVAASIKILFLTIRFSFSFQRTVSFKISTGGIAPWQMTERNSGSRRRMFLSQMPAVRKAGNWEMQVNMMPVISICNPLEEQKQYCIAFLAVVDYDSFKALLEMLLSVFTCDNIEAWEDDPFDFVTWDMLCEAFAKNMKVHAQLTVDDADKAQAEAVSFPMLPGLTLHAGGETLDYSRNVADSRYFDQISEYLAKLNADPCSEEASGAAKAAKADEAMPLCAGIAADYFKMLLSEIWNRRKELYEGLSVKNMDAAEAMALYQPDAEEFLQANRDLLCRRAVMPEFVHVLAADDTLARLDCLGEEPVWQFLAQQNGILRFGAGVSVDFRFDNKKAQLTPKQAAALFYVRYFEADITWLHYADLLTECGVSIDWECTEPYSGTFAFGWERPYQTLAGDTLVRMAKMLAVLDDHYQDEAWEAFYQQFLKINGQDSAGDVKPGQENGLDSARFAGSGQPESYDIRVTTILREDATPESLFRRVYPDFTGNPQERGLWDQALFQPLQEIHIGTVTEENKTVGQLIDLYGITQVRAALSAGKLETEDSGPLWIPRPHIIPEAEARAYILGKAKDVGGMLSRFFLQGLRIPAPTGEIRPLYELLNQQIPLSEIKDMELALDVNQQAGAWLAADSAVKTLTKAQMQKMLPSGVLPQRNALQPLPVCEGQGSYVNLFDTRVLDQARTAASLPEMFQKELRGRQNRMHDGQNEPPVLLADGRETTDYQWSAVVEIAVRRIGQDAYLVAGASAEDRRRLLAMCAADVETLKILFTPSKLASDKSQLVSAQAERCVLAKTNLSVQTHMGVMADGRAADMDEKLNYSARLADSGHFLALLWQCSVIGGGFYLHCEGILEDIFTEDGQGSLSVCAVFRDFVSAQALADSIILPGNPKELVFYDAQKMVYTPAAPVGCVSLVSPADENGEIGDLFQIMGYTAHINGEDIESAPVFPQKRDGKNVYLFTIPLYRLVNAKNCYSAVGKTLSIELGIRDILGNYARLRDMELTGEYNDEVMAVGEYPETRISYEILDEQPAPMLRVCVEYAPPQGAEERDTLQPAQQENDAARAKQAVQQLSCKGVYAYVTCSAEGIEPKQIRRLTQEQFGQLKAYAAQLHEGILSGDGSGIQNVEFLFALDETRLPAAIYPLETSFGIVRGDCDSEYERIRRAESTVPAQEGMQKKAGFGKTLLASCGTGLYGVPRGNFLKKLEVRGYEYGGGRTPMFYAMAPFSNQLITRKVSVELYDGSEEERMYVECDLNAWLKRFFEDVESLLSGENACLAAVNCPKGFEALADGKRMLAERSAERIQPLCSEFPPNENVKESFKDYYLASLSNIYALDVAAVYQSDFQTAQACRAEIALTDDPFFLPQKITGMTADNTGEENPFIMLSRSAAHRNTQKELHYIVQDLEYNIDAGQEDGYDSSDWVRLHQPLRAASNALPADFGIPHPLALCPSVPVIRSQEAFAGQLACWNYQITMSASAYEQHTIYLRLEFEDTFHLLCMGAAKDMFGILADYDSQRDSMFAELAAGNYSEVYEKAGKMAQQLAEAPVMEKRQNVRSGRAVLLKLQMTLGTQLVLEAKEIGNALQGLGARIGKAELLSGKEAGEQAVFSVTIENLPLVQCQAVQPFAYIVQNENLLEGDILHIRDEFLFRTEEVAAERMAVFIDCKNTFDLGNMKLKEALDEIWQKFSLEEENPMALADLEIRFSYTADRRMDGFEMDYPVTFVPQAVRKAALADNIERWFLNKKFTLSDGRLYFRIWLRNAQQGRLLAQMRVRVQTQ